MATERDQHWSKLTKETKSELKLDTSIPESTLARGLSSQNWAGVATVTSWLGWADCQGCPESLRLAHPEGRRPSPWPSSWLGSLPHLDYTTILSAWAQGSCPRGLCFKPGESPASTAPWTASRLLCQPEPPQLTDKHRSSLLPAPAAEAWPCLLLTGSAQPDSLQVFVKRRGVACRAGAKSLTLCWASVGLH